MKKIANLSIGVALGITVMLVMAATYVTVPRGTIYQAYVDYKDSDTITIKPGYGECNGNYWDIMSDTDHDMSSLASGEDFHYIYVDGNNSNFPDPNIFDSTTEPSWSDSKLGWYNGNHRCIGVVWSPSGSSTIQQFTCNSNLKYTCTASIKTLMDYSGNPDGTLQFQEATAYIPVIAIAVLLEASNNDSGAKVACHVASYENFSSRVSNTSYGYALVLGWLELERNSSRDLQWQGQNDDNNEYDLRIYGYQIER